jgi:endonuclease YncB( thermonuclease family)
MIKAVRLAVKSESFLGGKGKYETDLSIGQTVRRRFRPSRRPVNHPARRPFIRGLADICLMLIFFALVALLVARIDQSRPVSSLSGNAYVIDGDTLVISKQHVRLKGIDAPELDQTCGGPSSLSNCGKISRQALQKLVSKTQLRCEKLGQDKYSRVLAICFAGQINLNRVMVETGQAVAYGDYHDAELLARRRKAGIWADRFETPQDWRKTHERADEAPQRNQNPVSEIIDLVAGWVARLLGGVL